MPLRNPEQSIVPIVRLNAQSRPVELLGTGFIIGPPLMLVTAKHVLENVSPGGAEAPAVIWALPGRPTEIIPLSSAQHVDGADLAIAELPEILGAVPLALVRARARTNLTALCFEFSHSSTRRWPDGSSALVLEPYTHMGNIVRCYNDPFDEAASFTLIETSFPALQGASGAPVVRMPDFAVVGMLLANRERHLLPAQVVRVEEGSSMSEEVRYFLPFGWGYSSMTVADILEDGGIPFVAAPEE